VSVAGTGEYHEVERRGVFRSKCYEGKGLLSDIFLAKARSPFNQNIKNNNNECHVILYTNKISLPLLIVSVLSCSQLSIIQTC